MKREAVWVDKIKLGSAAATGGLKEVREDIYTSFQPYLAAVRNSEFSSLGEPDVTWLYSCTHMYSNHVTQYCNFYTLSHLKYFYP